MADRLAVKDVGQNIMVKYKDLGDGSCAEVVAVSAGNSAAILTTDSTQTAATGSQWTALTAGECSQITLQNLTGTTISYRLGTTAAEFDLPTNSVVALPCVANSNEWQIRRKDTSNTRVFVQFMRIG